jgi:sec-independent protein translocase protein TatA
MGLGFPELVVIAVALLILFGARRIPEFARGLGQGVSQFKKSLKED